MVQIAAVALAQVADIPLQFGGNLLWSAVAFLVLAIVAGVLGAGGIARLSMDIAKWPVIIFVVLVVLTAVL